MTEIQLILSSPGMTIVLAVILIGGIVRGFSGFGSGMIIGPTTAAILGPKTALAMLVIIDSLPTLFLAWPARKRVDWSEIIPVVLGYALLVPIGVWFLKTGNPVHLRWFITISILAAVAVLWSGWRYTGPRSTPVSVAVGGLGGFMGSAAQLPGPPTIIYWLASGLSAGTVRANMIVYLFLTDIAVAGGYFLGGIFTFEAITKGIVAAPVYLAGILLGAKLFGKTNDVTYKTIAFVIILISAISSMPALDQWLRG